MRLSFGQQLKMAQKQILAPRMIQSMEILQLPILALQERIEQEIEENPVLDLLEVDPDLPDEQFEQEKGDTAADSEKELVVDETRDNQDDFERLDQMNDEWPETFEERRQPSADRMEQDALRRHDTMANMVNRPQTLQDHLHNQISWFDLDEETRLLVDRIIYNLDADGRLQGQLCDLLESDAPPERLALA
ncbi:MAG: RNA polymerase sigma-54 factor, partial [Planctomycetota bacterium]|nr:RNA polymerase sigma-54 factor [Planctomycetota bacterium]